MLINLFLSLSCPLVNPDVLQLWEGESELDQCICRWETGKKRNTDCRNGEKSAVSLVFLMHSFNTDQSLNKCLFWNTLSLSASIMAQVPSHHHPLCPWAVLHLFGSFLLWGLTVRTQAADYRGVRRGGWGPRGLHTTICWGEVWSIGPGLAKGWESFVMCSISERL